MFMKTCRCGKTKKNFKFDIGPFFVDECCIEAGFDELGKKKLDLQDIGLNTDELANQINSDATSQLEVQDEGEQPEETTAEESSQTETEEDLDEVESEQLKADEEASQADEQPDQAPALTVDSKGFIVPASEVKTEEPKKKRQYNRSGKLNIKKESTES